MTDRTPDLGKYISSAKQALQKYIQVEQAFDSVCRSICSAVGEVANLHAKGVEVVPGLSYASIAKNAMALEQLRSHWHSALKWQARWFQTVAA